MIFSCYYKSVLELLFCFFKHGICLKQTIATAKKFPAADKLRVNGSSITNFEVGRVEEIRSFYIKSLNDS